MLAVPIGPFPAAILSVACQGLGSTTLPTVAVCRASETDLARFPAQASAEGEPWTWRFVPYLFAANLDGDLSVGGTEVSTDVSFSDLLEKLDFGAMAFLEGHRGRWGFAVDGAFIDLGEDGKGPAGVTREADAEMTILGAAGLYRVSPSSPCEIVLGLRYLDVEQELTVGPATAEGDAAVLDGIVGGRALWPFAERWRFALYGDVGAGDSDFTWQGVANLGYDVGNWGLDLGYRILDYDFEEGSKELDAALEGWQFGVEYRF